MGGNFGEQVFVPKLTTAGDEVWTTLLDGGGSDKGYDIQLDSNQYIYITGETDSSDFPGVVSESGFISRNAFVSKLAPNGDLLWSSIVGGSNDDVAFGIDISAADDIFITGMTSSDDFPITSSESKVTLGQDVFVAKFNPEGGL